MSRPRCPRCNNARVVWYDKPDPGFVRCGACRVIEMPLWVGWAVFLIPAAAWFGYTLLVK